MLGLLIVVNNHNEVDEADYPKTVGQANLNLVLKRHDVGYTILKRNVGARGILEDAFGSLYSFFLRGGKLGH
jgi:hypothetical protein